MNKLSLKELKEIEFGVGDGTAVFSPVINNDCTTQRVIKFPCSAQKGPSPVNWTEVFKEEESLRALTPVEHERVYDRAYYFWSVNRKTLESYQVTPPKPEEAQ